jgi:phosphoribosylaminoimidazole-succinocarboxamide synthase
MPKTSRTTLYSVDESSPRCARREHHTGARYVPIHVSALPHTAKCPQASRIIGQDLYNQISQISLELYSRAASFAHTRGLILADTKFEFGLVPTRSPSSPSSQLILIDELLTPDSSRYWPLAGYKPGVSQPSFDKQYLRDWLVGAGFRKGLEGGLGGCGWEMEETIVRETKKRYEEAVKMLVM